MIFCFSSLSFEEDDSITLVYISLYLSASRSLQWCAGTVHCWGLSLNLLQCKALESKVQGPEAAEQGPGLGVLSSLGTALSGISCGWSVCPSPHGAWCMLSEYLWEGRRNDSLETMHSFQIFYVFLGAIMCVCEGGEIGRKDLPKEDPLCHLWPIGPTINVRDCGASSYHAQGL